MMIRRRTRVSVLMCLLVAPMAGVTRAETVTLSNAANPGGHAARLANFLAERGMSALEAEAVIEQLSFDDIQVLAENPEMLQAAGDANDAVGAALLVILFLILLAAAAAA